MSICYAHLVLLMRLAFETANDGGWMDKRTLEVAQQVFLETCDTCRVVNKH